MTLTQLSQLLFMFIYPALAGLALGAFYYGGLWLILRRLSRFEHPAVWISLSLVVRTFIVVLILYLLFADSWQQLLLAVAGMLITRTVLVQCIKPEPRHIDKVNGTVQ